MSTLLDRGNAVMVVYPEIEGRNRRGELVRYASPDGVKVRFTVSEDRSSDAELPGQVSVRVVRGIARNAPVGSWSRIEYDGLEWDIAFPPTRTPGPSRALRHVEFSMRSRNQTAPR